MLLPVAPWLLDGLAHLIGSARIGSSRAVWLHVGCTTRRGRFVRYVRRVRFPTPQPLLLPSQRRELFETIRDAGFDPHEFDFHDDGRQSSSGGQFVEITHQPTGYYFHLFFNPASVFTDSGWFVELSPGSETRVGATGAGSWSDRATPGLNVWLELLERELDAGEDPWEQIRRERQLVAAEPDAIENTPFTESERAQITTQLREIKEYLRTTRRLPEAQLEQIASRLHYLEEAAGRIGRVDWRNAFVGVMLGLVVQAVAPPDAVREVLSLACRGLSELFGGDIPELPPGGVSRPD